MPSVKQSRYRNTNATAAAAVLYESLSRQPAMTAMQTAHISALEAKHATLDQRIAAESQRPVPDTIVIAELKKQKLRLKEEITSSH